MISKPPNLISKRVFTDPRPKRFREIEANGKVKGEALGHSIFARSSVFFTSLRAIIVRLDLHQVPQGRRAICDQPSDST